MTGGSSASSAGCMKDRDKIFVLHCTWVHGGSRPLCAAINRWGIERDYLHGRGGLVNLTVSWQAVIQNKAKSRRLYSWNRIYYPSLPVWTPLEGVRFLGYLITFSDCWNCFSYCVCLKLWWSKVKDSQSGV